MRERRCIGLNIAQGYRLEKWLECCFVVRREKNGDTHAVPRDKPLHEKARFRKSKALLGLGKAMGESVIVQELAIEMPGNEDLGIRNVMLMDDLLKTEEGCVFTDPLHSR